MRLDSLDNTPFESELSGSERLKWLKRKVLGDPRRAPRRVIGVLLFGLILALVVGVLHLARTTAETSGSSFWLVSLLTDVIGTLWFALPAALYIYYRSLGRRRTRYAAAAAEKTGWLTDSIKQLSDAVRSTDHTNRLITTTDDDYETIRQAVDAALRGDSHPLESVDYYGRGADPADGRDPPALPEGRPEENRIDAEEPDVDEQDADTEPSPTRQARAWLFVMGRGDRSRRESTRRTLAVVVKRLADLMLTAAELTWNAVSGIPGAVVGAIPGSDGPTDDPEPGSADSDIDIDHEVPWRVRFAEELKHFILDFSAGYRSDDITWRFALPAGLTMVLLLLIFRLWVHPVAFAVFAGISALVGAATFWASKRVRSRRLQSYRRAEGVDHWDDVAGLVKTVETPDVTAYVGFAFGRSYASYDRDEFVDEFALRLWQRTHDEHVSPSILEQYARNLAMYKPNLSGHKENIERPAIMRRIKRVVEETEDQVVGKAELAYRVIEPVDETVKFERELGHDPRLVADEYRWLVEQGGVLAEMDVSISNAKGTDTELTLIYPSEKSRLPDVQQIHSQLSDRFHGRQGEPFYRLPIVDPSIHISPFEPSASVWANGELPSAGPRGYSTADD